LWDFVGVALVAFWLWLGAGVYDAVNHLGEVGELMESVGASLSEDLTQMGDTLGSVPLIGDGIRAPFDSASDGAASIEQAGLEQQAFASRLAWVCAIGLVFVPIVATLAIWLIPRRRFVLVSGKVRALAAMEGGDDLLALRALASRPIEEIAALGPDVAQAWRRGDPEAISRLAALEKRAVGLLPRAAPPAAAVLE